MTTETRVNTETVETIMSKKVETVGFNTSVADALKLMAAENLNAIPVVNVEMKCVGMLSRADLTETLLAEDLELARWLEAGSFGQLSAGLSSTCDGKLVREVMTHEVKSVLPSASIKSACLIMKDNHIHHLPVVNEDEKLEGILSTSDVINWLAD